MYHLGNYPGIRPCAGESVLGEVYYVRDDMIAQMDEYEEEGFLYLRLPVTLHAGLRTITAEAYVYNHAVREDSKMREIWNAKDEDLVWYAAYGSNLSSRRFSCYLSGGTCPENGRTYPGSADPAPARAVQLCRYPGRLYFGNRSPSWHGCGVAFYVPAPESQEDTVYMKRYLITRRQLHDVMAQEGASPYWYGRLVCLEVDGDGIPVYTLTCENRGKRNAPAPGYQDLIAGVLAEEFRLTQTQIRDYLAKGMQDM